MTAEAASSRWPLDQTNQFSPRVHLYRQLVSTRTIAILLLLSPCSSTNDVSGRFSQTLYGPSRGSLGRRRGILTAGRSSTVCTAVSSRRSHSGRTTSPRNVLDKTASWCHTLTITTVPDVERNSSAMFVLPRKRISFFSPHLLSNCNTLCVEWDFKLWSFTHWRRRMMPVKVIGGLAKVSK